MTICTYSIFRWEVIMYSLWQQLSSVLREVIGCFIDQCSLSMGFRSCHDDVEGFQCCCHIADALFQTSYQYFYVDFSYSVARRCNLTSLFDDSVMHIFLSATSTQKPTPYLFQMQLTC
mmetsp:Transcript_28430/g.59785  ORF Transcript_28430/g.59785 Transcript_28430/m.59785 type:complete len:118 (+) Transcript_28430:745-1098(+)